MKIKRMSPSEILAQEYGLPLEALEQLRTAFEEERRLDPDVPRKHARCEDCTHPAPPPKAVVPYSTWELGGLLYCVKKKGGGYNVRFDETHHFVMGHLYKQRNPIRDYDLVFGTNKLSHQLGAVRCRLHQAGVVDKVGKDGQHDLWVLNEEGRRIWKRMHGL